MRRCEIVSGSASLPSSGQRREDANVAATDEPYRQTDDSVSRWSAKGNDRSAHFAVKLILCLRHLSRRASVCAIHVTLLRCIPLAVFTAGFGAITATAPITNPEIGQLRGSSSVTHTFAWMSDGRTLLSGEENGAIFLWDTAGGAEPKRLDGHEKWVSALVPDPSTGRVYSAGHDGRVIIWNVAAAEKVGVWEFGKPVLGLAISPKAGLAAVALKASPVKVVSLADGRELRALEDSGPHSGWDGPLLFLDDGESVVTTGERFVGSPETARLVAAGKISPDAGRERFTGIWSAGTGALRARMPAVGWESPKGFHYNPKRDRLAELCVSNGAQITEWSVTDIAKALAAPAPVEISPVSRRTFPHAWSQTAVVSPSVGLLLTNAEYFHKYRSRLWDLQTGRLLFDFDPFYGYIGAGAITPDGRRAIVDRGLTGPQGQLSILDLTQRTKAEVWAVATNNVLSLQARGPLLCAMDGSSNLRLWNREIGQEVLWRSIRQSSAPRVLLDEPPLAFVEQPSLQVLDLKSGTLTPALEPSLRSLWPVFEVARDGKAILIGNSQPSTDSDTLKRFSCG
jgi:WD40 repeat protein